MREIKFRGMGLNGEWYYGHLSYLPKPHEGRKSGYYIANSMGMPWAYPVRPETVGQFIGRKDKNGVEIYENDKVHTKCFNIYTVHTPENMVVEWKDVVVRWLDAESRFSLAGNDVAIITEVDDYEVEITGNTHENPELIPA